VRHDHRRLRTVGKIKGVAGKAEHHDHRAGDADSAERTAAMRFLILLGIIKVLRWAMLPVMRYTLAS